MIVSLYYVIPEMDSFPMSVANNFCDMPLPKYLDSKTAPIYRPHPVYVIKDKFDHFWGIIALSYTDFLVNKVRSGSELGSGTIIPDPDPQHYHGLLLLLIFLACLLPMTATRQKLASFSFSYSGRSFPCKQCCGSGMFIPDPGLRFPDPGSKNSNKREGWKKN